MADGVRGWLRRTFTLSGERSFAHEHSVPYSILINGMFKQEPNGTTLGGRREAMEIPSVLRGRNLICGISTLPLESVDAFNRSQRNPFLEQIDPNVANVVTLAQTFEDLLFEAVAWWKITAFNPVTGMPLHAIRIDPGQVSLKPPADYKQGWLPSDLPTHGVIWMNGEAVPFSRVIRFDSPNPPLLEVARRIILRAIKQDMAASVYADSPRAQGYFTSADPLADPFASEDPTEGTDQAKVAEFLAAWAAARRARSTAYVPSGLKYADIQQPTPADLQLVQLQQHISKEIAIAIGLDPEEVGVSTTSRTYANDVDRRKNRINDLYAPYMEAVTQRLSMPDVTMPGERARFRLADYLRADPRTRMEVNTGYIAAGVITREWVADDEGVPPEAVPSAPPGQEQQRPAIDAGEATIAPVINGEQPSQLFLAMHGGDFE